MTIVYALQLAYTVAVVATVAYVLPRGGGDERRALGWLIACSALTVLVTTPLAGRWRHAELGVFAVDTLLLIALGWLMLRSNRHWLIAITAVQLVDVVTHVAMLIDPTIVPRVYAFAQGFWAYPMLLLIVAGSWRYRRRGRRVERAGANGAGRTAS